MITLLLACAGDDVAPELEAPADRELALVYSHDLHGEIEPCG